jgi:hypothetical protein
LIPRSGFPELNHLNGFIQPGRDPVKYGRGIIRNPDVNLIHAEGIKFHGFSLEFYRHGIILLMM